MKKIAYWGAANPATARFLIALGHVFLIINALWLGFLFYAAHVRVPSELPVGLMILFVAVYWCYPEKHNASYSFVRRKAADFILIVAYTFALGGWYNATWFAEDRERQLAERNRVTFVQAANRVREAPAETPSLREQAKQLRKELRTALRQIKEDKPISVGLKILLIALSVLAALWLALLIALLGCNIACSGNEGLATVVMIFGWAGVLVLAFLLIRLIARRPTKRKQPSAETAPNES